MIVVPQDTSIDWLSPNLYLRVARELRDVDDSYNLSVCVRDWMGRVVASRSFTYTPSDDVVQYVVDLSSVGDGVYWVDVNNWFNCTPPLNAVLFRYLIHKISDGVHVSFEGWDYRRMHIFAFYVYDGKLFMKYLVNASDMVVPSDVPVYIEASDASGNAFVGVVRGSGTITVRPNMRIPFMATFRIKVDQPRVRDVARYVERYVGYMHGVAVQLVDDYTFNIVITKIEPGLSPKVAFIVGAFLGGIAGFMAAGGVRIVEVSVQAQALESARQAVDMAVDAWQRYVEEVEQCPRNDIQCIEAAQRKWLPLVQITSALAASLMAAGFPITGRCNGLNVGGVCVPWWVVAVAIFLAGLLVIAAVK
jgi:hypothetical protein